MSWQFIAVVAGVTAATSGLLAVAGPVPVPNASFESPSTGFVSINVNSWQKRPKPDWYNESGGFFWNQLVGAFKNTAPGSPDHLDNCDGNQAIWLFANPENGFFQDYDSMDWNDSAPTHDFNAVFEVGKSYVLTVGVNGGGGGMLEGVTMEAGIYYRDEASNMVTVAATSITNTLINFPNHTHLFDYEVQVPAVLPEHPWAGKHIGIRFFSTITSTNMQGGYWDLDNVRLQSVQEQPVLRELVITNGQFQFALDAKPGLLEILVSTNTALATSNWTSLGTITNVSGSVTFTDTNSATGQRFYQARMLPWP